MTTTQKFPMFERLEPRTPFQGGRITENDVLDLPEAARFASVHAGTEITPADFLRAAGRGEITMRAIVHQTARLQKIGGGVYCNAGQPNENTAPKNSILTLPLTACQHLAATGRASWREFESFESVDGVLMRFVIAELTPDEPDFETTTNDCRVTGNAVNALADAFTDAPEQSAGTPAHVVAASVVIHSTKARRDTLTPVIELAQSQCRKSTDTAEVWGALLVLAEKKTAPLIGATEDGLQYLKGGTAEIFTRKSLGKRLTR